MRPSEAGALPPTHTAEAPRYDIRIRTTQSAPHCAECEEETIRLALQGDARAWEVLVRQNIGWVYVVCCRWTRSHSRAEDLAQEVFIRVFQSLDSYRGDGTGFRNWLRRIATNLLIDDYRKNRSVQLQTFSEGSDERIHGTLHSIPSCGRSQEDRIEWQERRAALRAALRMLPSQLREAVILRDVQGLSYQEIGQLLNLPIGTVKSRVNRGRIELTRVVRSRSVSLPGFHSSVAAVA